MTKRRLKPATRERLKQLWAGVWIGVGGCAFAIPGFWWLRDSAEGFEGGTDVRMPAIWGALGALMVYIGLKVFIIMANVLLGKTSARLARRDFRNILGNLAMGAKTGLWKE